LAREPIRLVGREVIIGDDHAPGGRRAAFREPARGARLAALDPLNDRMRRRNVCAVAAPHHIKQRRYIDPGPMQSLGRLGIRHLFNSVPVRHCTRCLEMRPL